MNSEDLLRAIGGVDPKLLAECERERRGSRRSKKSAAVLLLVAASILLGLVSAVWFSVKISRNQTAASVEASLTETEFPASEENPGTAEIPESEASPAPEAGKAPTGYAGISEIELTIVKISDQRVRCAMRLTCEPGYVASGMLLATLAKESESSRIPMQSLNLSRDFSVSEPGSYQAGAVITVYDMEGNVVNSFSKHSEPVTLP